MIRRKNKHVCDTQENRNFYKDAFNHAQKCLDDIWHGLYGDLPICDTGNFWNCDPIIRDKVIADYGKGRRRIWQCQRNN